MILTGKRIAVTGARGFIGRHLTRCLYGLGAVVDEWDIANVAYPVDLTDARAVEERLAATRPAAVFHLAATAVGHNSSHDASAVATAVSMASTLVGSMKQTGSQARLVVVGSMAEYGRASHPIREDFCCRPMTAYAIAKLAATCYFLAYGPPAGLSVVVPRLFGVYGPGERMGRLFPALVEGLSGSAPVLLSDGNQVRDFVHVADVVRVLVGLMDCDHQGLVNVGTGQGVRVRDAARWVAGAFGKDASQLKFGARERSPGDEDHLVADCSLLEEVLGWLPPQRVVEGMEVSLLKDEEKQV